jgi:hypothetical protein
MINDLLLIIFFSCLSAAISYMLDYGLGKPGSDEISVTEFLTGWTFILAKRRLIKYKLYNELTEIFLPAGNMYQKVLLDQELKKTVIEKGKDFFTWEKAFGMCIICTGFWIALALSIIFIFTIELAVLPDYLLLSIVPFSQFILRRI